GFKERYPNVKFEIEGKGSATAPAALTNGASQFGPMSRPMTAAELEAFEKKHGYKVSSFRVAVDALAVYVNKENPHRMFDDGAGGSHFFVSAQGQRRQNHRHLGRCWLDGRLGVE